jgi:putative ABC transport system permease protein
VEALRGAIGQDAVVVSESFSLKQSVHVGDRLTLRMPCGPRDFRVVAVYYDYSNDRGVIVMDQKTLARHFGLLAPTSLTIYLRPGASADTVRAEMLKSLDSRYRVFIYTNSALRSEVLRIFDSTFAITYALELIAIFVAILGIASALLTLILERARGWPYCAWSALIRAKCAGMVVIERWHSEGESGDWPGCGIGSSLP